MSTLGLAGHLLRYDVRRMGRDPMLSFVFLYGFVISLALRWGWPALERWLLASYGMDWTPYRPLVIASVALLLGGFFLGILVGFLLLEEREDGTLNALRVSPMPLRTYLLYRVALPVALSFVFTPAMILVMGLGSPPWHVVFWLTVANAPLGALGTLYFPSVARDKVQAFAYSKLLSFLTFLPIAAVFLEAPWWYFTGVFPGTWNALALRAAMRGEPWVGLLVTGAVTSWLALWWLLRRFERVVSRG